LNIRSAEFMSREYPRTFKYSVIDHRQVSSISSQLEAEDAFRKNLTTHDPETMNSRDIFIEYVADIEAMVSADILIGSTSNVYMIAAALRMSRYPERPLEHTCWVELGIESQPFYCENSKEASVSWRWNHGFRLEGGVPSWNDVPSTEVISFNFSTVRIHDEDTVVTHLRTPSLCSYGHSQINVNTTEGLDTLVYHANYIYSFKEAGRLCTKKGANRIHNRDDNLYALNSVETVSWSFHHHSYTVCNRESGKVMPVCASVPELLDSSRLGVRSTVNDTRLESRPHAESRSFFHPFRCTYKWYSPPQICSILSNFSKITTIGDSDMLATTNVLVMLASGNYIRGAIARDSKSDVSNSCVCDGQLSQSRRCVDVAPSIRSMANSHAYGICQRQDTFQLEYKTKPAYNHMYATTYDDIEVDLCFNDTRPRLTILHFGFDLALNPVEGLRELGILLVRFDDSRRACKYPYVNYFIWITEDPKSNEVSLKYNITEADIALYNKMVYDFTQNVTSATNMSITFLNSSEIIRGGGYVDGFHPLSEAYSIRAMYVLNILDLILPTKR